MKKSLILLAFLPTLALSQVVGFTKTDTTALSIAVLAIDNAKVSIDGAIYQFTSVPILQAMGRAVKRGVKVRIVMDKTQTPRVLLGFGATCRIDHAHVIMHHKFMTIDGAHILTGSFNWSANAATRNAENALYLPSKDLAASYEKEFLRVWDNLRAEECQP